MVRVIFLIIIFAFLFFKYSNCYILYRIKNFRLCYNLEMILKLIFFFLAINVFETR